MLRFLKKFAWAGVLVAMVPGAWGYALLGDFDSWQTDDLSYHNFLDLADAPGIFDFPLGGAQNIGEEYRWNIPILNYSVDQTFLDYFGSNGVVAIDQAMAILNSISNVSSYSSNLAEVPLEATRINFRAQALSLWDMKSAVLHTLVEGLGLADPVRYAWTLRSRVGACPAFTYLVIQRNFDPVTWEPSPYVNDTLYTYRIVDFCPVAERADAFEHRVDPLQTFYTAVASPGIFDGSFFTGLTRDDIGGLRYLYRTNNVNLEDSGPGTLTLVTNTTPQLLTTSNLNFLVNASLTNDSATLQALFPGLQILSVSNSFAYVPVTNVTATFTNAPWAPAGTPAQLVLVTNVTFIFEQLFHYTFGNLFTIQFTTNGPIAVPLLNLVFSTNRAFNTIQTITAAPSPYSPPGTNTVLLTNITSRTFLTNQIGGEFFILPPGACDIAIIAPLATNVVVTTNVLIFSTNTFGATNVNGQSFTQIRLDYFTNHTFVIFPVICDTTNVSFNQGIEKITFVRRDFDSLLGRFFNPITNEYVLNSITNSMIVQHRIRRVVTAPDILFNAADLAQFIYTRDINFTSNNVLPGLNGPGLIEPSKTITFNKVGPAFFNDGPFFLDEANNALNFLWGFFDGTTNAPIIFPSGTSIKDYENQVLMQVTTTSLASGNVGSFFSAQLQGSGGQPPYTWSLAPASTPLPPGLTISANGVISGSATTAGSFTFTVLMTDAGNRSVARDLTITISP